MSKGGFSATRLRRIRDVLSAYIDRGEVAGLVALICRHGEVHVEAIGTRSIGDPAPMKRDTIFRIASMTKPVVAVASLILVDEGRLRLDDPVDPYLPELANRRVLKSMSSPLDDTVPANRSINVRDLLTLTLGIGAVVERPDTYPIQTAMANLKLGGDGPPRPSQVPKTDEWIRRLGSLPLMHQPGERWVYNTGSDVLGVLIERVTGQRLETFFQERIFAPLGMKDTSFVIAGAKRDRFAASYAYDYEKGALELYDGIETSAWDDPESFQSGAGGLVSTVDDYLAFSQMLLNVGRVGKDRLISRLAVEAMTTDQLTPAQKAASSFVDGFFENNGWGYGLSIILRRDEPANVPGTYGWSGGLGTFWTADPHEDMTLILLTQRMIDSPLPPRHLVDFRNLAYAAIDD
jgi:CubicO group peptidase (beta-lactamase class C family)